MAKEPTIKQRKAMKLVVENGGNVSKAMRDAGYSPATAENPKKLTDSKTWQELMDEFLPDDFIIAAVRDDIKAKPGNRVAELTLAAKMKGRLTERVDVTSKGEQLVPVTIDSTIASKYASPTPTTDSPQ